MSLHPTRDRIRAFRFALRGLGRMLSGEVHARFHAVATIGVVILGFALGVTRGEWLALLLAIALVWCAEAFNTAFESLCDLVARDYRPEIERAKDVSAGAVLAASIGAALVGIVVFGPRLIALLRG
jgi:diacylglycerol kinase (ATP)